MVTSARSHARFSCRFPTRCGTQRLNTKRQIFTTRVLRRDLEILRLSRASDAKPSIPADLPENPAIGDEPGDLAPKASRDHRPPGDEGEFLGVLDQGAAAGGELDRLAVGAADRVAGHGHAVTSADEALAELRTLKAQGYALVMGCGSSVSDADLTGAFAP